MFVYETYSLILFVIQEECQNYIRVLARKSEDTIFVCGTNAFKPLCRQYQQVSFIFISVK